MVYGIVGLKPLTVCSPQAWHSGLSLALEPRKAASGGALLHLVSICESKYLPTDSPYLCPIEHAVKTLSFSVTDVSGAGKGRYGGARGRHQTSTCSWHLNRYTLRRRRWAAPQSQAHVCGPGRRRLSVIANPSVSGPPPRTKARCVIINETFPVPGRSRRRYMLARNIPTVRTMAERFTG